MARVRRVCFTSYEEAPPEFDEGWMSYLLYGREVCPTTGRVHWQGYVELSTQKTLRQVIGLLSPSHVEVAKGSAEENILYCSKDGEWVEWGESRQQGRRSDLAAVHQAILAGTMTVEDVLIESPNIYHQYGRTIEKLSDLVYAAKERDPNDDLSVPTVHWFYGTTGTGKTRAAWQEMTERAELLQQSYWVYNEDHGWWDTYQQQELVLIDDFRGQIPFHLMLRLLDRYPVSVSRRNKQNIPFVAKEIWITSSLPPQDVYQGLHVRDHADQLVRRCGDIRHFS